MAKTYEAISKSERLLHKGSLGVSPPSDKHLPNLTNTKQMGDLKKKIELLEQTKNYRVFHFASSRKREGVSTVVINLARFMIEERSSKDILLIDANLQQPVLHTAFDVPSSPGLSDALIGKVAYSRSIYKADSDRINVMPCGTPLSNETGRIEQKKFADLISSIKNKYDYIFIDSSPLLVSSDSLSLAIASDTTFLVIHANETQWEVAEKAKLYLQDSACSIDGVILSRVLHYIPQCIYKRL